jgi:peptidoglycan/xylan/chitin deacetylase (PgdA/CDA1 family)
MRDPGFGALVLSLDFELHWGVRDREDVDGPYRDNLLGAREVIPRILDLFERYEVGATWATVGFLFARTRAEVEAFAPDVRPTYADPLLDSYAQAIGDTEEDDPLHMAASLVERIASTHRQEVASHTFSHFFCLEAGAGVDAFRDDLASAHAASAARDVELRTIVFPYNQVAPAHRAVLAESGFQGYRGTQRGFLHRARSAGDDRRIIRLGRLVDAYVPLHRSVVRWDEIAERDGVLEMPASRFLRPYDPRLHRLEPARLRRITSAMDRAASANGIVHVWWHPHNFGRYRDESLAVLEHLLQRFATLRDRRGMRSMTMADVVDLDRDQRAAGGR